MKNDVVRWNKQYQQQEQQHRHPQQQQNVKKFLNNSEHLQNVACNNKTLTLTTSNISTKATKATTTKLATTIKQATKLAIDCDNSLLVQPIELTNLHSRHFHRNATSLLQQADSEYCLQRQHQQPPKQPQNNRCYRTFNATHCLSWFLQLTVLVILCQTNNGFALSLSLNTNDTLLSSSPTPLAALSTLNAEIPQKLAYDDNSLSGTEGDGHFTHTWAVHIPNGDEADLANKVAADHGFINLGKIFGDHYHFAHHRVSKRSVAPATEHQTRLDDDHRVHWAKQQKAKSRRKRDFIRMRPSRTSARSLSLVDAVPFDDPKWPQMWYLNRGGGLDMNVIPAWKEGITGKGIVVTILDDGLESDHPDIEHNYDPKASYDVNSHDDDPMPHYDLTDSNRHGTRCAGEVAATANNSKCAVGIAFGARVGGVRMLDGDVTDAVEARSLSLNPQHIDIYSASWGPDDDGKTVDGPGELASRAFLEGVTKGREGKGSIFIWASGNGGRELDNCNCDGYTNSIWTLSISSATEEGHVPWYSEKCSSTLATTYSSGSQTEKQVVTTDLHHSCTVSHTGTSASAPLAAGIAALVLESNTNLTWRDLQHIVVRTAKPANLKDVSWSKNGVGRRISHSFGYGLMDAAAMVKVARTWKTVPEQQRCEINAPHVDKVIPSLSYITLQLTVKHCSAVNYLEHVQAKITLTSQRRGDIQLYLKSPAGTKVTLLTSRKHDVSRSGFNQWPFMSVHTWGESPHGNWQLEIHNEGRYTAKITQWDLIFYGTETPAQPDDPVQLSPGQFSPYGNDMDNNDIDFDNSGQWRNMKQVGDNSLIHDKTNASCLTITSDNRCLACAPPTFLYKQHCYDMCPLHTYEIKAPNIADHYADDKDELMDNTLAKDSSNEDIFEQLQAMDRRRRTDFANEWLDNKVISELAPPSALTKITSNMCIECDKTCSRCYGPLNSQCSTCYPGSQLRKLLRTNETFCYAFTERSTGNSDDNADNTTSNKSNVFFVKVILIAAPIVVCVSILIFFLISERKCRVPTNAGGGGGASGTNSKSTTNLNTAHYAYDRVALLGADDDVDAYVDVDVEDDAEVDIFTQPIEYNVAAPTTNDRCNTEEIAHELAPAIVEYESSDSDTNAFEQIHRI